MVSLYTPLFFGWTISLKRLQRLNQNDRKAQLGARKQKAKTRLVLEK
jgi:hypothetical protein